jgi:hypothetical protein
MVEIQDTLVSLDVFREQFCCDLGRCKGQCCVEGDAGAPVDEEEIADLEEAAELLSDELTPEARQVIDDEGVVGIDRDGTFVTSVVNGRDCVFAVRGDDGTTLCAIDRAHREGRTAIEKPLSCALYPIRLSDVGGMTALNYHRWDVCRSACELGKSLQLPVYRFLKEPLVRAFGQKWWDECELVATELKKAGYLD